MAESGKKGRARGSEADLAQCGALALPPPFLCLWLLVQFFFFQRPLDDRISEELRVTDNLPFVSVCR